MRLNLLDLEVMSSSHHVIVDGSNLATEGRMIPSLAQLDDCVQAYRAEDPTASIVVVVDATFGHRIDPSEKATYDEAIDHGELLTPPAGAVGRGDGFILKIAEKVNAVVLSNDSFQEFHGEYPWLFDLGRLIGGKPVPTIGWVFTPRSPVRGPKSRHATSKAQGATKVVGRQLPAKKLTVALPDGTKPKIGDVISPPSRTPDAPTPATPVPKKRAAKKTQSPTVEALAVEEASPIESPAPKKRVSKKVAPTAARLETPAPLGSRDDLPASTVRRRKSAVVADAQPATADAVVEPAKAPAKKRTAKAVKAVPEPVEAATPVPVKKRAAKKADGGPTVAPKQATPAKSAKNAAGKDPIPVNEAMGFLTFVSAHPVDSIVSGQVASFTSHGAMVAVVVEGDTSVLCYAPTKHLSQPAPKSAREVLTLGQSAKFTVLSLDVKRRVAEVTLAPEEH